MSLGDVLNGFGQYVRAHLPEVAVDGVEDSRGRCRLYTEAMINVVRIAAEEELLDTLRCCSANTWFCERVAEAWAEL